MPAGDQDAQTGFISVTPAERIGELNDIDHEISKLLSVAAKSIGLLSNEIHDAPNPKLADVQAEFEIHTREYSETLSAIYMRLRRQVYALEEAGLIGEGTLYDGQRAKSMIENQASRREGGGPLDSSWLNARANDTTGQALKRETLQEAKKFLRSSGIDVDSKHRESMQVDTPSG